MKNKKKNYTLAKNTHEIAIALGLDSFTDIILIEYKSELSTLAVKAITQSGLTVNEVVKRSGVARSKVSAIKNGALAGISCDLFLKVIAATGTRVSFKLASGF